MHIPAVSGYNADTHIVHNPADNSLAMFYRVRGENGATTNELRVVTTKDGASWTAPVTVMSGAISTQDFASPSVYFNKATNKWNIIAHNLDAVGWPTNRYVSNDLLTGYTKLTDLNITAAPLLCQVAA